VNGHGASALPHEAEAFQGEAAGLVTRGLAAVIDVTVVAAIMLAAYVGVSAAVFAWNPRTFRFPAPSALLTVAVAGAIATGYLAIGWWIAGRTYGSAVLGLRVVDSGGGHIGFVPALVRAAVCALFPIGLTLCAIDPKRRGLHDMVIRSRVIYDWRQREE
jgi:uncharacterized RDD family membrane protein YckC